MKKTAFTLIETLIVVVIVAVLATAVTAGYSNARTRSRDARRVSDMTSLQAALEGYNQSEGSHPLCTNTIGGDQWCGTCSPGGYSEFQAALQPLADKGYLPLIAKDPLNDSSSGSQCYTYEYYTPNQSITNTITCGGKPLSSFEYVMRFGTEKAVLNHPVFSYDRVDGMEYCVTGPGK
ncbi:MAG: Type II secretion system protein G precursor [bacterium ADurb.Bin400]|nr:MAG: Type II secretion system protein G precursor [bacterium ADurb.Bin400]